jgi:FAD/FMN-containing dehydrogenase
MLISKPTSWWPVRAGWDRLQAHSVGVSANFLSDEGSGGLDAAYGERLERLTKLKDRYDPDNVFRLNANIEPRSNIEPS